MTRRLHFFTILLAVMAVVTALIGTAPKVTAADAQPGAVDPTFAQTHLGMNGSARLFAQPDGKILAAGSFTTYRGVTTGNMIRIDADGTRDTSFSLTGTGFDADPEFVLPLSDGKMLVAGGFTTYDGIPAKHLLRLNADGSRDNTFNQTGTGLDNGVRTVVAQSDGKLLVGGYFSSYDGAAAPALIRLNADGSRDNTFNQTGLGLNGEVWTLSVLGDGRILVGGMLGDYDGTPVHNLLRLNADGTLDNTFAQTGTGLDNSVWTIAVQGDGKILAGGNFDNYNGAAAQHLLRLDADGSRDNTFAQTGSGILGNGPYQLVSADGSPVIPAGGKILVAGLVTKYDGTKVHGILRLNSDGSRDNGFAQTGTGLGSEVDSVTVLPDLRILASGWFQYYNSAPAQHLVRLNSDGTRDSTFGYSGHGNGLDEQVDAVALQPDGKILVGGYFTFYDGDPATRMVRLNADGTRDTSFALQGSGFDRSVLTLAVLPDGKILVGGYFSTYDGQPAQGLLRLNADGSRDNTFTQTGTGLNAEVAWITVQADGKILAGGYFTQYNGDPAQRLIRLNADGSRDNTFTQTGTGLNDRAFAITVQPDGKILVGGGFTQYNGDPAGYLIRLNPDGSRDSSFSMTGTGLDDSPTSFAVLPDAKILVGGYYTEYNGQTAQGLLRLNPDGSRDNAFAQTGTGLNKGVYAMTVDADGKIVAGGAFDSYNGSPAPRLIRLNADGTRDSTFNQTGTGLDSDVYALAIQPDGKVVVGGYLRAYNGIPYAYITRILGRPVEPGPTPPTTAPPTTTPTPTPTPTRRKPVPLKVVHRSKAVPAAGTTTVIRSVRTPGLFRVHGRCRPLHPAAAGEVRSCTFVYNRATGRTKVRTYGRTGVKVTVVVRARPKAADRDRFKARKKVYTWKIV